MPQLRYDRPAREWNEALPLGNGRMGAMVFGQPVSERLQLNEDSIWYGGPIDRINPDAGREFPKIRQMVLDGRVLEAEQLMQYSLSGTPQSQRPYQTAGDMELSFSGLSGDAEAYCRYLDLETGVSSVSFEQNGCSITKEYLASNPDQIIAIHLKASQPGALTFSILLTRSRFYDHSGKLDDSSIFLDGTLGDGGNSYVLAAKTVCERGTVRVMGERLLVEKADEATIYVAMETSFYHQENYRTVAEKRLQAAAAKGYDAVKKEHIIDYQALYKRVSLKLGDNEDNVTPLAETLIKAASGSDKEAVNAQLKLAEIYFQFGRYLLISSSRPGSLPANLQGIWNKDFLPPWDSKYTININTQMNYWPAEVCNLSECHEPLFDLLNRMHPNGKRVAREMYGYRGFVAHNNTDIWADCAPQGTYIPASYWVTGAAWLCTHIWTHYLYTGDRKFLAEMYPVLEDSVLFFHDYLLEDQGEMVVCPNVSPENTYYDATGAGNRICKGASMDAQILRDLFGEYLKISKELGRTGDIQEETARLIEKLPPIRIGRSGQIMEWTEDYDEAEPGHRHVAHLYALYPSHQITPDKTPELAKAAEKTLERRFQYTTSYIGWNSAWFACLYAKLRQGDKSWEHLKHLWESCTLPNFMDSLPVGTEQIPAFQIDGNFGGTVAIAEMLLQSDEERTILLPALPECWKEGYVSGLKTVGGAEIYMEWRSGELTRVILTADHTMEIRLIYKGMEQKVLLQPGVPVPLGTWKEREGD